MEQGVTFLVPIYIGRIITQRAVGLRSGNLYELLYKYSLVHDLNHIDFKINSNLFDYQFKTYIEGVGIENNKADSLLGLGLENNYTSVIAKTDKALTFIFQLLNNIISEIDVKNSIIKHLQFDVFGFSRGSGGSTPFH